MRLTNNDYLTDALHLKNHKTQWEYNNELWQYVKEREDIEEELCIDLITLFNKATVEVWYKKEIIEYDVGGNWYKELDRNVVIHNSIVSRFDFQYKSVYIKGAKQWFSIKDYGKTWALSKKELL